MMVTFTCYLLLSTYYIYSLVSYLSCHIYKLTLSNNMLFVNSLKFLQNFILSLSLLTGLFSDRITAAFSLSLSCANSLHSYRMWSTDYSPCSLEYFGLSIILYLNKYILILTCPVTIAVKLGVALILSFNLSANLGKERLQVLCGYDSMGLNLLRCDQFSYSSRNFRCFQNN